MNVGEYLVSSARHFVPIENVPVIAPATRLGDALTLMTHRQTTAAVIQRADLVYDLFMPTGTKTEGLVAASLRMAVADLSPRVTLPVVSENEEILGINYTKLPSGIYSQEFGIVGVLKQQRLLGLLTTSEFGQKAFFTPAAFYTCSHGHIYYPPTPSSCPLDGTPIQ